MQAVQKAHGAQAWLQTGSEVLNLASPPSVAVLNLASPPSVAVLELESPPSVAVLELESPPSSGCGASFVVTCGRG